MIRKAILAQILLIVRVVLPQESIDVTRLVNRALNHDHSAFADSYLADKFDNWQQRFPINSFTVDTLFRKGPFYEAWLTAESRPDKPAESLAILFSNNPAPEIIDIRSLMLAHQRRFNPPELAVVELVERFVWTYETGIDGFVIDLLYPRYIMARFRGLEGAKEVLSELRRSYQSRLTIQAIEWEYKGASYDIRIRLDSPLKPLELSVNMHEYLTARFFEDQDKSLRTRELWDSILHRSGDQSLVAGNGREVRASSGAAALSEFLDGGFVDYDLLVLDKHENEMTIEINPPLIHNVRPVALKYHLEARPTGSGGFDIITDYIALNDKDIFKTMEAHWNSVENMNEGVSYAINEMIQRYGSLGLGPRFSPRTIGSVSFRAAMFLHTAIPDSIVVMDLKSYHDILRILSHDKVCYFFPRSVSRERSDVTLSAYAFWSSKGQLWHHLAEIRETYRQQTGFYRLSRARVDFYPFIRDDNLLALFGFESDNSGRKSFRIKR